MNTPMHLCLKQVQLQRGSPLALLAAVVSLRERTSNGPVRTRRAQSGLRSISTWTVLMQLPLAILSVHAFQFSQAWQERVTSN
jgi:hypothetical protein